MKLKFKSLLILALLLFPVGSAFAGVAADYDAQIVKEHGRKAIFVEGTDQYIDFCGAFSGELYYGDVLVQTDPSLLLLKKSLPVNAVIHFNGGITGGGEVSYRDAGTSSFCMSDVVESKITIFTEEYSVQEGDTLRSILREQGGNANDAKLISAFNGLTSPRSITVGQTLIIPLY